MGLAEDNRNGDSRRNGGSWQPNAIPLYEQVKRHLSEIILLGEWKPGTILPNEADLSRRFGVAVGTVRRALSDLAAEGVISRRPRVGTVVTGRSPQHSLRFFFQYFRLHGLDGALLNSEAETKWAERGTATEDERARLRLAEAETVVRLRRVRRVAGRPAMHDFFVLAGKPALSLPIDDVPELLYMHLLEHYGIRISAVRESLSAESADARDQEYLGVRKATPILQIDEIAFDQTGTPALWAIHRAVTDSYRYINEVS